MSKARGERLARSAAESMTVEILKSLPETMQEALKPLVEQWEL